MKELFLFYTYLYLRGDGSPYYVGKGTKNRAYRQATHRIPVPEREKIIVEYFDCESDALFAEKFLIAFYGRKDLKEGILLNLTDGGEQNIRPVRSKEWRRQHSLALRGKPWSAVRRAAVSDEFVSRCQQMGISRRGKLCVKSKQWQRNITKALQSPQVREKLSLAQQARRLREKLCRQ